VPALAEAAKPAARARVTAALRNVVFNLISLGDALNGRAFAIANGPVGGLPSSPQRRLCFLHRLFS
jgi:hypothetical protein